MGDKIHSPTVPISKANYDKSVKLCKWDRTWYNTLQEHSDRVYAVAFSLDGKTIISASTDRTGPSGIWILL